MQAQGGAPFIIQHVVRAEVFGLHQDSYKVEGELWLDFPELAGFYGTVQERRHRKAFLMLFSPSK